MRVNNSPQREDRVVRGRVGSKSELRELGNRVLLVPCHRPCEDDPLEKFPNNVSKGNGAVRVAGVQGSLALVQHEELRKVP